MSLFYTRPLTAPSAESADDARSLRRTLGPLDLTLLGIGAVVGAGIFVLTGVAAALHAGPAVPVSMALAGVGCAFAGLCYAELAASVPAAGSAYTYAYATLGELVAWIIGWDLVLEYAAGAATVAVGWSATFNSFLGMLGLALPPALASAPLAQCTAAQVALQATGCPDVGWHLTGAVVNLPAAVIVLAITVILVVGIRQSATLNTVIVLIKTGVLVLFVAFGLRWVNADNWRPFIPPNTGEWGTYGWSGILRGAGLVFFAFIGFDAVSTTAQEARRPQRDLPIGILVSLVLCTVLYMAVSAVLTGLVSYRELNVPSPVITVVERIPQLAWFRPVITIGAVLGLGSTILVMLLGQSRVFYAMSTDGLLGRWAGRVHPRFRTPWLSTLGTGVAVALFAAAFPIQLLGQLVNIGTLLAFIIVCGGVVVLRRTRPDLPRPFRTPLVPLVPIVGMLCCLGLMATLPADTWVRLAVWLVIGLAVYFGFGRRNAARTRESAG